MIPPPVCEDDAKNEACVSLLRSLTRKTFYLGWTKNLKRRLCEHQEGRSQYTKGKGPWELIVYEVYETSEDAMKRERALKKNSRMYLLYKKRMFAWSRLMSGPRQVVG